MRGLPLGWEAASSSFGFDPTPSSAGGLILNDGEAPVTVIAPTGSGKGVSVVIPACLTHQGPLFVIDIKGEISAVCARRRREMGYDVRIIDPFGVTAKESDRIDPFDLFDLPGGMIEADAEMLATILGDGNGIDKDPFWVNTGTSFLAGLIALSAAVKDKDWTGVDFVRNYIMADDVPYAMAVLLDTHGKKNAFAYGELAAFLQHPDQGTRPSVLSTTRTFLRSLNSPQIAACLQNSTIPLADIVAGKPMDVFLVLPPAKLISHAGFLKLVVGTMMAAIMRRTEIPERRTMLILDEAAQLGKQFEPLLTATTLLRGYGLKLMTVWQDFAQIKSRYPTDYPTILNNSGAVICFGQGHFSACSDAGAFLGVDPHELLRLKPDEAALAVRGEGTRKVRRVDYLKDRIFAGMADPNPFYGKRDSLGR